MDFYLLIDGKRIEWGTADKIRLERFNPLFDFDTVQGSRVADFTIPFSPESDRLFNWYYLPQSKHPQTEYYCEKYVFGVLIERGFIYLVDVSEDGYVVAFTMNLGEIFGDYQNISLNKLPLGNEVMPTTFMGSVDYLTAKYCLPSIMNDGFYGSEAAPWYSGIMNDYSAGAYVAGGTKVPMLFARFFFEKMGQLCNFRFEGSFFDSPIYKRMIFYNTFSLDDQISIDYANHLPEDMTFPELLLNIGKLFNVVYFFDVQRRVLTAKFGKELMRQPVKLNWTTKIAPSKKRTPELTNRLQLNWELENADDLMKVPYPAFEKYQTPAIGITGNLFEITSKISTLSMANNIPITKQGGISKRLSQSTNQFKLRILFWHGLVGEIPTAKNFYENITLAWNGPNNLVYNFWSDYENWRKNTSMRPVLANLSASDLALLDFHGRAGEYIAIHSRGRDYYIKSVKAQLPLTDAVELELWEC